MATAAPATPVPTGKTMPLIRVQHLQVHFPAGREGLFGPRRVVRAVDGLTFDILRGETLGLVGESGCGKSTTGRAIVRLIEPTGGQVWYGDRDLVKLSHGEMQRMRQKLQIIFQDAYASLSSRMRVSRIVGDALAIHRLGEGGARAARVGELLHTVGLDPAFASRYPHEFSGGQRQRIGIARALAVRPEFIVCDEPISALDVSIRAQILNLLADLQQEFGLTYLFIAHDLAVVRHICDRVAVMYLGKLMELAPKQALYDQPLHPYTRALMSAVPVPDPDVEDRRQRIILSGDVPSPVRPPSGCVFHTRCPIARQRCAEEVPVWHEHVPGHWVACHFAGEPLIPAAGMPGEQIRAEAGMTLGRPTGSVGVPSASFDRAKHQIASSSLALAQIIGENAPAVRQRVQARSNGIGNP